MKQLRVIGLLGELIQQSPTILSPLAVLFVGFGVTACNDTAAKAPVRPPPQSVTVAVIDARPVPIRFEYAGRVTAFREVEVRARVSGFLMEKAFVEGAGVKAGDVLFRIDPASYDAELARAKAQLMEAQAQMARTERDASRATTLFQRQYGSEKVRDDAVAAYESAKASVAGAEARVRTAEINLSYTKITAPISGITSLRMLPEGSLVDTGASGSLLTRISQLDPMYVHFSFTDTESNEIRQLIERGQGKGPADGKLTARISFGDGKQYDHVGYVDFTDSSIDLKTGMVRARAVIPNSDMRLRPGQFVRVSVEGITRNNTIVVPQAAVMQGPLGQFVYVIDTHNRASIRPLTIGREIANGWIVESGLNPGDRIVIEGVIKVRPGVQVSVADNQAATTVRE